MNNDARLAILETTILNINTSLQDIKQDARHLDSKIDAALQDIKQDIKRLDNKIDTKFDVLDKKIDTLDKKLDSRFDILQNRIWSNFLWLMTMIIGLAGLIAHTQHWL